LTRPVLQFSRPYQIATDVGVKIFLPARYAEEIKNIKQLSFKEALKSVSLGLGKGRGDRIGTFAESQTHRNSSSVTRVLTHWTPYPIRVTLCKR